MKKFKHTNADLELARIQTDKAKARGQEEDGAGSDSAGSEGRRFGRKADRDDPTVRHNDAGAGRTRRYNGGSSSRNRRGRRRTAGSSSNSRY
ncbi:MAG: hypothetical protein J4F28_01675 [Nitrosopumilaceae archaeon]|nr:hypothetical protein [Nitrosopumilaceae archaeon]